MGKPCKDPESKTSKKKSGKKGSDKSIPHEEPKDTNMVGNITKLLPGNTFLMFQLLAPVATNDGHCGRPEFIMTSAMLIILASTCMLVCFTDTIQFNGKVYHGLVTKGGLWNPSFRSDPSFTDLHLDEHMPEEPQKKRPHLKESTYSSGNTQYECNFTDILHAVLSAMAFGTLTMLTNPVIKCFYPKISVTVVKTLPLLAGFVISGIFAFSPPARNGIANPLSPTVHRPPLPFKPPGKGDNDHANPKPDDDDLGGSVKKHLDSPDQEEGKSGSPTEHHQLQDGVKALARGLFSKFRDDIKHGAEKIVHSLEGEAKKEANQLLRKAAPAAGELSKDNHVSLLLLQEATKSVPHDALVAEFVNAGAHPALATAAVQSAVQDAKNAALNQMHQELQSATSGPLAGLSKQSSKVLMGANSMLQSSGSSLSLPSGPNALFHQAAQVLQPQVSGLSPNVHAAGSEAVAIALASRPALWQAAYQLPGTGQSPQATALNAFTQNIGNQLTLNSANDLMKDGNSLVQQGSKSLTEILEDLARQSVALNSQMQAFHFPGSSAVQNIANSGSQTLSQGTFAATLAAGATREAGTLLLEGADHGMAGVQAEIARQKVAAVQSIAQPVTSLAQDAASRGSHSWSDAKVELLKQKENLTQEMNIQARALSAPGTAIIQDLAALFTTQVGSQPTVSAANSQFVESLALGVAQGMAQAGSQPAASVAIDIASLLQQGSQMHAQLARQASALSSQMQVAATTMQRQVRLEEFQHSSAADTHMALRHLASQLSSPPPLSSPAFRVSQGMSTSPSNWRDNASLIIEDVTAAAAAGHTGVNRAQRGASQLPRVTEEIVAQAEAQAPTASQIAASEIVADTFETLGQVALASMTHISHSDRQESIEIVDSLSTEEITSESEAELNLQGNFRVGSSCSFNLQGPVKKKL